MIQYTAFGEIRLTQGVTPTKYRYTGQLAQAELGLDYYVARWYDPVLGHFTQADTIVPEPENAKSFNRYMYTENNPVKHTDSTGHCIDGATTILCIAMGAGAIAGYAIQVGDNLNKGLDWGQALTTNISGEKIIGGALIAGGVVIGAAVASIGLMALGTGLGVACADGDCTNEVQSVGLSIPQISNDINKISQISNAAQNSNLRMAQAMGKAGEVSSGIVRNNLRIESLTKTAKYRIPDQMLPDQKLISEVKNVTKVNLTNQLRDYVQFSEKYDYTFELYTRIGTKLSKPIRTLIEARKIIHKKFK